MKAQFVKLESIEETVDGSVTINVNNISSIRRINYNDTVQTIIQMIGGERFGVHETVDELTQILSKDISNELMYP